MVRYSKADLKKHLQEEHKITPLSEYLKEIVYGGNDGIITTFAVVAGFAGAQGGDPSTFTFITVLLFGTANLFADATSMGLGNYLSTRSDHDVYNTHKKKELHEIEQNPDLEIAESVEILKRQGFTKKQSDDLITIYKENKEFWADFMMRYELEMQNPEGENPFYTALATFIAFIIFGSIPLIPYVIFQDNPSTFLISCIFTFAALLTLGLLRWKITKISFFRAIGENLLIGGTAAIIAYIVGTFFRI